MHRAVPEIDKTKELVYILSCPDDTEGAVDVWTEARRYERVILLYSAAACRKHIAAEHGFSELMGVELTSNLNAAFRPLSLREITQIVKLHLQRRNPKQTPKKVQPAATEQVPPMPEQHSQVFMVLHLRAA